MKLTLHGGFGEKGRTSLSVEHRGYTILLDCGINASSRAGYYPAISDAMLSRINALIVTHAHEDHIGAVGWCILHGFGGRLFLTAEAREGADAIWSEYAAPEECERALQYSHELFSVGRELRLGPFRITSGRSGHIAGGFWCHLSDGLKSILHCGDVAPNSPIFPMDRLPRCGLLVIDASYGCDDVTGAERAAAICAFTQAHPASILPVPLMGRSLELFSLLGQPLALAPGMRQALTAQLRQTDWIAPGLAGRLFELIGRSADWTLHDPWPDRPLLCHDGMGIGGPAHEILKRAAADNHATLFTGHLPHGSPGERMLADRKASWHRFPTHPTLSENLAIVEACQPELVLGHSCPEDMLQMLGRTIPRLDSGVGIGDVIDV